MAGWWEPLGTQVNGQPPPVMHQAPTSQSSGRPQAYRSRFPRRFAPRRPVTRDVERLLSGTLTVTSGFRERRRTTGIGDLTVCESDLRGPRCSAKTGRKPTRRKSVLQLLVDSRAIGDRREPLVQIVGLVPAGKRRVPQRTACSLCATSPETPATREQGSRALMLRRSASGMPFACLLHSLRRPHS